jgi:hypothetical protein
MNTHASLFAVLSIVLFLVLNTAGCALFEMKAYHVEYSGAAKDGHTKVRLIQERRSDAVRTGSGHNYAELSLEVTSRDVATVRTVGRKEGSWKDVPAFSFGDLEARIDSSQQRVWIIDKGSGEVITAFDRDANILTGVDQPPPAWATSDRGDIMDEVNER